MVNIAHRDYELRAFVQRILPKDANLGVFGRGIGIPAAYLKKILASEHILPRESIFDGRLLAALQQVLEQSWTEELRQEYVVLALPYTHPVEPVAGWPDLSTNRLGKVLQAILFSKTKAPLLEGVAQALGVSQSLLSHYLHDDIGHLPSQEFMATYHWREYLQKNFPVGWKKHGAKFDALAFSAIGIRMAKREAMQDSWRETAGEVFRDIREWQKKDIPAFTKMMAYEVAPLYFALEQGEEASREIYLKAANWMVGGHKMKERMKDKQGEALCKRLFNLFPELTPTGQAILESRKPPMSMTEMAEQRSAIELTRALNDPSYFPSPCARFYPTDFPYFLSRFIVGHIKKVDPRAKALGVSEAMLSRYVAGKSVPLLKTMQDNNWGATLAQWNPRFWTAYGHMLYGFGAESIAARRRQKNPNWWSNPPPTWKVSRPS